MGGGALLEHGAEPCMPSPLISDAEQRRVQLMLATHASKTTSTNGRELLGVVRVHVGALGEERILLLVLQQILQIPDVRHV